MSGKGAYNVTVSANTAEAKQKLKDLGEQLDEFSRKKREALKAGNLELSKSLGKEISVIRKEMAQWKKQTLDVEQVLQNINKVPLNQIQSALRSLRKDMMALDRDSDEYYDTLSKIRRLETQVGQPSGKSSGKNNMWAYYLGGGAVVASLERLASRAVNAYQRLDDKMADVQKTTDLSKEGVIELDKELQKIDTRSSREELLDMARIGGKLGIEGQENLAGFVRVADKLKVALSEDLGGNVEETIRQVGKLVGVFDVDKELGIERGLEAVGSTINELGASSTANEAYIVDFTNRVAGVAAGADIAIPKVMGIASTMDILAQTAEVSGTTYGQVMTGMQKRTEEYARIAGMSLQEFRELLDQDQNEAFIRVMEGLGKMDSENRVKALSTLKLEGQRATQVLGALADKTDLLREQQTLANEAFEEATSLQNEFNVKNESAAAIMEKRRKVMDQAMTDMGEKLFPLWSDAIGLSGHLLQALSSILGVGSRYIWTIVSLTATIVAYNAVRKLQIFYSREHRAAMVRELATMTSSTAATKLLAAAKLLLAGNVRAAGTAFKMFWASVGPLGWIVTIVGGIATAFSLFNSRVRETGKSIKDLNDINKAGSDAYIEEKTHLERLLETARDKNASDQQRLKAIEDLKNALPDGIKLINEETIANGEAAKSIEKYCEAIRLRAKIEAGFDRLKELEKEEQAALDDGSAGKVTFGQKAWAWFTTSNPFDYLAKVNDMKDSNTIEYKENKVTAKGKIIEGIKKEKRKLNELVGSDQTQQTQQNLSSLPSDNNKKSWTLDQDEGFMQGKLALQQKRIAGELSSEDEYNRQLQALEIESLEARIASGKESGDRLLKLQNDLAEKKYRQTKSEQDRIDKLIAASLEGRSVSDGQGLMDAEKNAYDKRLKDLGLFGKSREQMTAQEQAASLNLEQQHLKKLQQIYVDAETKKIQDRAVAAERSLNQTKQAHNQELAAADTFEAKKALVDKYQLGSVRTSREADRLLRQYYASEEEKEAREHYEKLIEEYTKFLEESKNIQANGFSLGSLNEEETERVQQLIDELNKKLAELKGAKPVNDDKGAESRVDILGYTQKQWEDFFKNLDAGKDKLGTWQTALQLVGQTFGEISNLMSAAENREFRAYEKTAKKKKKVLDDRLKKGLISQEAYNTAVEQIDDETDRKKEELERKQAIRSRALAVFQTLVNTSVAVTSALGMEPWGPWNIALAALVGALGAIQTAAVLAAPLPGAEDGGYIDVVRSQDGKRFRAKRDPDRRGYIGGTSVIVSEDGTEFVASAAAVRNPTIRPVLDIIDVATRNGSVDTINLPAVIGATLPGRASGGYLGSAPTTAAFGYPDLSLGQLDGVLQRNAEVMQKMLDRLDRPIAAYTRKYGPGGLFDAIRRDKSIRKTL